MRASTSVKRLGAIAVVAKQLVVRRKVAAKSVSPRPVLRWSVFGAAGDHMIQTKEGGFRHAATGTVAFGPVSSNYQFLDAANVRQADFGSAQLTKAFPTEEADSRHAMWVEFSVRGELAQGLFRLALSAFNLHSVQQIDSKHSTLLLINTAFSWLW